jgi:hypothetical protein
MKEETEAVVETVSYNQIPHTSAWNHTGYPSSTY